MFVSEEVINDGKNSRKKKRQEVNKKGSSKYFKWKAKLIRK